MLSYFLSQPFKPSKGKRFLSQVKSKKKKKKEQPTFSSENQHLERNCFITRNLNSILPSLLLSAYFLLTFVERKTYFVSER